MRNVNLKVKWITAHNCGKPKLWHSFTSEKGKFWVLTLSHKMCPRKQTTEPKLVIFVSFFSGEVIPHTHWRKSASGFYSSGVGGGGMQYCSMDHPSPR